MGKYNLVHIIAGGEYKTPLVASQVFDRAEAQATTEGVNKPVSVSVWIMAPMREVFDKSSKKQIEGLKKRCPHSNIEIIGGISRFHNWPAVPTLKSLRKKLAGDTVFCFRGEASFEWAYVLKKIFPADAYILDVRGFWPLERLVNENIVEEKDMLPAQLEMYHKDLARLKDAIQTANKVCTVSEPLLDMLIEKAGAPKDAVVIPCCVKDVIPADSRERVRKELNIEGSTAILYLGGTQKYQHLDDLVIPFLKSAISLSEKNVAVIITQNRDKMMELLTKYEVNKERVRMLSVPQDKVADYLAGMDIGLLLRAPSVLINTSQPVKFGEYLSAGIPVVLEEGMKKAADILDEHQIGCVVKISGKEQQWEIDNEVKKALDWFGLNKSTLQVNTRRFVEHQYTWKANVQKERTMYIQALEDSKAINK